VKFENAKILVALLSYPFVENECIGSVWSMLEYSNWKCPGETYPRNTVTLIMTDGTSPARAHNHSINTFLDSPDYKSLLIIGRDHIFKQNALQLLYEADKDMIGGITMQRFRAMQSLGEPQISTVHDWKDGITRALTREECLEKIKEVGNQPFEVPSIGDGFMLFKRKVFEKIPPPWFYEPPIPEDQIRPGARRGTLGCDICFFKKARELGLKAWAHPGVQYVHIGRGYTAVRYDMRDANPKRFIQY